MHTQGSLLLLVLSALCAGVAVVFIARQIGPVWDRVSANYVRDLQPTLDALNLNDGRLSEWMRWWGFGIMAVFFVLTFGLGMWPIAPAVIYLIYMAPRFYLQQLIRRRSFVLRDQLVGVVASLANSARAGLSLAQGLENIGAEAASADSR